MTPLFAADWLSISINLLLVIHIMVCLLLALLVLMQRPKQEGLGAAFGAGVTDQAFGARTTDVLQKGTVYAGTIFFILTLVLAILIGKRQAGGETLTNFVADKAEVSETVESVTPLEGNPEEAPVTMPELPEDPTPATPPAVDLTPAVPVVPAVPEKPAE